MRKTIVNIFCLIVVFSCSNPKHDQVAASQSSGVNNSAVSGEEIFNKRCVSCHGHDGKMGFSGAKDLTKSSLPLTMIEMQVTHGKGAMNGFEKILSAEEIKEVSAYAFKFRERI